MPQFSQTESTIKNLFITGQTITFKGKNYLITNVDKPSSSSGEPKTDVYVGLENNGEISEIKISIKQTNADFIENKMQAERAKDYFGENWKDIIQQSTSSIKKQFEDKNLIFKSSEGRTTEGCITLGWKFELLNKSGGKLSGEIVVDLAEAYKGTSLNADKRDAYVNGIRISNSGIAEYLLFIDNIDSTINAQTIINNLVKIDDFIKTDPKLYFACKALNYRSLVNPPKWDGNRPLAVYVNWTVTNGKLNHSIIYNVPLTTKGNIVAQQLKDSLDSLGIQNTTQINHTNVTDPSIICN